MCRLGRLPAPHPPGTLSALNHSSEIVSMAMARQDDSKALAALALQAGPRAGEELPVLAPVVTLGQGPQNGVVLADDSVSKTHARLAYEAGEWRITDLNSTNGTYVDGVRLAPEVPTPLPYGATVRLGGMALHFRAMEAADPEAARASYTPPPAATPLAQRSGGFRLPVWAFLLILILLGALLFFLIGDSTGTAPASAAGLATPPVGAAAPPGAP